MDAVLACRQLLLLHATLMEHGLDTAAGLLAFALHQRGLVGWLGRARPRTFLVPAEAAASRWLNDESGSQLLQQGQKAALFCLLANHVRDGRMTADELRTLLPGVSIVEGDIPLEDGIVHVIDRVLG
jgi:uncharacterized surface protein with fasciclin (FAS1) repeats